MTTINLKDFYPWYTHDEYTEVSDEVAEELMASRRREAAHTERARYVSPSMREEAVYAKSKCRFCH